ncbi:dynein regulatory complex subunit 7 isoform X2 [Mastacembelus armatus]|uniref:Dynein regulatory complex subunit 7 n=1 Tax=Mastacembelus armatus TaxID=205130 RepID=A0A3Q3M9D6_9TELE|nr:dynein regulatory complex subunit 7 isoform X2 [Mastacembelus armatus]
METVVESSIEEQLISGDLQQGKNDDRHLDVSNVPVSASQDILLTEDKAEDLCPESYRVNSADEIRLLSIADNFQRQYSQLYPDRKPLLLCPVNEYGVKKFVSTTLRPTATTYPELFTWEGCACFVANFLSLDSLEPPVNLPRYLFSSTAVLRRQRATCFEYATLLCSLLLGAQYDAYCVSGYAVKELCLLDQSMQDCPLLDTEAKSVSSEPEQQQNKYTVKPLKELRSRFLMQQEKKKQDAEATLLQKQKLQEESKQPCDDPLRGLRVHCWVLVLSGSRNIQENFFIDPLTGNSYSTTHNNFLGIESVWNNLNYYVNMQDCSNGCADMVYDLEDVKTWEPILYGAVSKKQLILDVFKKKELKMMRKISNDDEDDDEEPQVFEMPRSWVSYISISKKDLETRWPGGHKLSYYRKAMLEQCAPYLRPDGLVICLTVYKDLDCTEVDRVKEWYKHRNDYLEEKEVNKVDNFTTERFTHGQHFHLLFHRFSSQTSDAVHEMEFSSSHVDGLVRRVLSPSEMTELFEGRDDFLYYRHVVFSQHVQFSDMATAADCTQFQKVVERFHRNSSKPANEDVAERVFLLTRRQIEVTYHLEDHRFIPSKRVFFKPQESTEQEKAEDFTADMVSSFQVDPFEKPLSTLTLYHMLLALMKDEEKVVLQIKKSKKEVRNILDYREQEEKAIQLHFSPWTTAGAAQAHQQRQEMERVAMEEQRWLQEKEKDTLAPFLIRLDDGETLSTEDAKQLHQDCLAEFKQRLVEHANLIQERLEKETQELQKKQQWYQMNQLHLTEKEENEYQIHCSKKTLEIHVAMKRLSMHKKAAPQKYRALDQKLKQDPRLAPHLLS